MPYSYKIKVNDEQGASLRDVTIFFLNLDNTERLESTNHTPITYLMRNGSNTMMDDGSQLHLRLEKAGYETQYVALLPANEKTVTMVKLATTVSDQAQSNLSPTASSGNKWVWIVVVVLLIIAAVWWYKKNKGKNER